MGPALGAGLRNAAPVARALGRHPRTVALLVLPGLLLRVTGSAVGWLPLIGVAAAFLLAGSWAALSPVTFEKLAAGPARRYTWRRHVRRRWATIAETCGLAAHATSRRRASRPGRGLEDRLVVPQLRRVRAKGHLLELTVRARAGQTVDDLDQATPRIASTLAAVAHRTRPATGSASGCSIVVELVMADLLTRARTAPAPMSVPRAAAAAGAISVPLGRTQNGAAWLLPLSGRHTLVAGCSGSGKGSVLWGICCGLAPAVHADSVRLWGVDLKRGVELAMGRALFSAHAYTPEAALGVLRALMSVIDERGRQMAGAIRLHEPKPGDPLHVLVIDELAALTAYADSSIRRDAERLLSEILTQGRALGVVVVACVQDPRKDVVSMRGLFTQTVALRLRSADETAMVLGDGSSRLAPAHRISPAHPGTAWIVVDDGSLDRARADYWPDPLIRSVAARYATPVHVDVADVAMEEHSARVPRPGSDTTSDEAETSTPPRPRRPRSPRQPKAPGAKAEATYQGGAA